MQRLLITKGLIIVFAGVFWPWIQKTGFGQLPGDIVIERENFRFYFPITSMIVLSVIVSLILWLLRK